MIFWATTLRFTYTKLLTMMHILIKASILVGFTPSAPLCLPLAWIMSGGRVQCSIASYLPPRPYPNPNPPPPPHLLECPLTPLLPLFHSLNSPYCTHLIPNTCRFFYPCPWHCITYTHLSYMCRQLYALVLVYSSYTYLILETVLSIPT